MTKQEFIEKIKPCKTCQTKRAIMCSFDVTDDFKIEVTIVCARCGQNVIADDHIHALANWNTKNHDNSVAYLVTAQKKVKPWNTLQTIINVESFSEIALKIQEKAPEYEIISIKELSKEDYSDFKID